MHPIKRKLYIGTGALATGLGLAGVFIPLMPTTCFILIAAWAFAKSSPEHYQRLMQSKHLGPRISAWQEHRIISRQSKRVASLSILLSFGISMFLFRHSPVALGILFAIMIVLLWFINSRPSEIQHRPAHNEHEDALPH